MNTLSNNAARFLYFVGKPYPQTDFLQTIRQSGYKIGIFQDKNIKLKNHDLFDSVITCDFSTTERLLEGLDPALPIAGLLCTYENYVVPKSVLGTFFAVPSSDIAAAIKCTDKLLMRQAFLDKDPDITPKFGLVASLDDALSVSRTLHYPLILKPTNLVKSLLVMKCETEADLNRNFKDAATRIGQLYKKYHVYGRQPRFILEEFVTGTMCSIAAFVDERGTPHFCEGIVGLATARDRGKQDSYLYSRTLPTELSKELSNELFAVAGTGISALGMKSTPAHVELMYNDAGVKLIEIGARIGGYRPRMYKYSYGVDLLSAEITLAVGEAPNLAGSFMAYSAVFELFPDRDGAFVSLSGADDTTKYEYFSLKAKPGKKVGPAKDGYKACAVVIVTSTNPKQFRDICGSVDNIRVNLS